MKKGIIIIFLLNVLIVTQANAKVLEGYGIKAGINSSDQKFDYSDSNFSFDTERKSNINGGIFLEWKLKPSLSLVTEVDYIQKGMRETLHTIDINSSGEFIEGDEKFIHKVNYLSFPILVKYSIHKKNISPYIIAGPRIDYLLGYDSLYLDNVYGNFKKTIIGGSFGTGIEIKSNAPFIIILEFRYDMDATDSYNKYLLKVTNNSYGFSLGIKF